MQVTNDNYKLIDEDGTVKVVECKNGFNTLSITKNGQNRLIHSKYDPVREARSQTADFLSGQSLKHTVIIFGLGLGYHLFEILKFLPTKGKAYIFEPCPYVAKVFFETGGQALLKDKRLVFFTFNEENIKWHVEQVLNMDNCEAFSFFPHPTYTNIYPIMHDALVKEINVCVNRYLVQKNTIRAFGNSWTVNTFLNYKQLFKSAAVKNLFGLFKNRTAVVVSAGPSLSKNVRQLGSITDKAVIICVDTAYRELLFYNIKPHLLISVSGGVHASSKLKGIDYNVPLVYKSQTSTDIVAGHNGIKFYSRYLNSFLDDTLTELNIDPGFLDSGGSVACSAIDLAVKLGVKNVVLVGQDLAMTDGKAYGEKTTGTVSEFELRHHVIEVCDIYGNMIKTLKNLNYYRLWIEEYISCRKELRFIDATEGGAKINGTEIMSLQEVIETVLTDCFEIEQVIKDAYIGMITTSTKKKISEVFQKSYEDYLDAKTRIEEIIKKYEKKIKMPYIKIDALLRELNSLTPAVRYSVLPYFYAIKNMDIGVNPLNERAVFISMLNVLEELDLPFCSVLEDK